MSVSEDFHQRLSVLRVRNEERSKLIVALSPPDAESGRQAFGWTGPGIIACLAAAGLFLVVVFARMGAGADDALLWLVLAIVAVAVAGVLVAADRMSPRARSAARP